MKKLGISPEGVPVTKEAQEAYAQLFEQLLPPQHLAAIRDLFPMAEALSDEELAAALLQASEQVSVW